MNHPIIASPYQNGYQISSNLRVENGRLYFDNIELAHLITGTLPGQSAPLGSPLEVVYLPKIRQQIARMNGWFAESAKATNYPGRHHYAYASKANSAEEVTRTAVSAGAHYETSSAADVLIVQNGLHQGWLPRDRMVINNGFKPPSSDYMRLIIQLRASGFENVIPVIEDLDEIQPLVESGYAFKVGLRLKIDKYARDKTGIATANNRFGMDIPTLHEAARRIAEASNLNLVMLHAMNGDVLHDPPGWLMSFETCLQIYADLACQYPSMKLFNWGGGFPALMYGSNQPFNYLELITQMHHIARKVSAAEGVQPPDLVGEYGRYTTADHGFHLFKVVKAKDNDSALPWYIIDGTIMSSFPDAWALGLEFLVLPLTNLDSPFQQVKLGGLTCDTDDVYPTRPEHRPLYLPVNTDELYIGFFGIGSYQEQLGGVRGVKHCLLPEANEVLIDQDADGSCQYRVLPRQSYGEILHLLGYQPLTTS